MRDRETEGHTRRVTELAVRLARKMGVPEGELTLIRQGALLHDIGKLGIPDTILLKPRALSRAEWQIMKQHPVLAYKLLSGIEFLRPALGIPLFHHERWDGAGYPDGLRRHKIPLPARLFAVVDVYDALTSDRPYRSAWTKQRALAYIRAEIGCHFDPRAAKAFLELANEIP